MIVDGNGLLGRAFVASGAGPDALVFARGVADSTSTDPAAFARETACIDEALDRAANGGLPFVYFTGAPIYGPFDGPVDERTPIRPVSAYGIHQAASEERIRSHRAQHLIVRLPNVVGAGGNEHQLIPSLRRQVLAGSVVIQDQAERDLIAADDVVRAVRALLDAGVRDRTVVVASGISTPVGLLATWLAEELGRSPEVDVRSGGERQRFRTALLRSLAPAAPDFAATYARGLIAAYGPRR